MTWTEKEKKRGRPPGAKSEDRINVTEVRLRCPKCSATDFTAERFLNQVVHNGIAPDGMPYTHINIVVKKCKHCRQSIAVRKYFNKFPTGK